MSRPKHTAELRWPREGGDSQRGPDNRTGSDAHTPPPVSGSQQRDAYLCVSQLKRSKLPL